MHVSPVHIAIIGSGPRGMSVLERLAAHLLETLSDCHVHLYLIDDGYVGTGRIWRTDQSALLLMNTVAQEISAFSGFWNGSEPHPGNGPSFAQWWKIHRDDYNNFDGYAPRAYYGEYLQYVLKTIESSFPPQVQLHKISARVINLDEIEETTTDSSQRLYLSDGQEFTVDATVIATGHATNKQRGLEQKLVEFAAMTKSFSFIAGDSAADMDLTLIPKTQSIGIIGMGLAFFDLIAEFTLGRGGQFITEADGTLCYRPSGNEPKIFAASRSGMPIPPRGRNQKNFDYEYLPAIYTRKKALIAREKGNISFDRDVLPLLEAELTLVHAETRLRQQQGLAAAELLRLKVIENEIEHSNDVADLAIVMGLANPIKVDLYKLAAPFYSRHFSSHQEFTTTLISMLAGEYAEAMIGNIDSPLKTALDVIRLTRSVTRAFVDFGGLNPDSHQHEFLNHFSAVSGFLSAGPPPFRIRQLLALLRAEVVTIVGPDVQFETSLEHECISMCSPYVEHAEFAVQTVIDARIPTTDILHDCSALTRSLVAKGIYTPFVNRSGVHAFETGGVNVTQSPFHPIRRDESIATRIYVLGIPTEHTRWFMQSGSSRPHKWIDFMIDADAIAADILLRTQVHPMSKCSSNTSNNIKQQSIIKLLARYRQDKRPDTMNLIVGIYTNEMGKTPVLNTVREAEIYRIANQTDKASFNITGADGFHRAVRTVLFPSRSTAEMIQLSRVIQTLGASGALHLAGQLIARHAPNAQIWLSSPTWENHHALLGGASAQFGFYRYQAANLDKLCLEHMLDDLKSAAPGDVVLLHVCCHNPTGIDPDTEQWNALARFCTDQKLIPLFDFAYQGFSHSIQQDANVLQIFMEHLNTLLICNSFSKNMSIYDERTGALTLVSRNADFLNHWEDDAKRLIRSSYSMPPAHGSFIVSHIINDPNRFSRWKQEIAQMRDDLQNRREAFFNELIRQGILEKVLGYRRQHGMFLCLNLQLEDIEYLRINHGIYLLDSGRICIASLRISDIPRLCNALRYVVQEKSPELAI